MGMLLPAGGRIMNSNQIFQWGFVMSAIASIALHSTMAMASTNVALNKPASSDSVVWGSAQNSSYGPAKAFDGGIDTGDDHRFCSNNGPGPHWLQVDLQSTNQVTAWVQIRPGRQLIVGLQFRNVQRSRLPRAASSNDILRHGRDAYRGGTESIDGLPS